MFRAQWPGPRVSYAERQPFGALAFSDTMTSFSELGLSPEVLRAVSETGYDIATPIQEAAIPVALAGRDVLGIAQTGTGKTAAFTLPMIDRLAAGRSKARMPRSLVIAPTRELADQVSASFEKYAKYHKLSWALLIGGVSFGDQEQKLDRGVDVLIATPGRLLDHFERGKLLLTGVQMMVVDEADRMLDMGFIPDIERIFKLTPPGRQTLFFSATMPPEITRLTKQFLNNPERIEVARPATTAETITQNIARIPTSDPKAKRAALRALMERASVRNGIVFCNRKSEVDIVAKSLKTHGFDAAPIHGDLEQSVRTRTLESFRKGALTFLVASDVAARGLDIPDVSHVFNYDVPHHADDYVHRIGRTGRAGRAGETFMLVTPADSRNLDKVLKLIKVEPHEVTLDLNWSAMGSDRGSDRGAAKGSDRGAREDRGRGRGRSGERSGRPERGGERSHSAEPERLQSGSAPEPVAPPVAQAATSEARPAERPASRRSAPRNAKPAEPRVSGGGRASDQRPDRERPEPDRQRSEPARQRSAHERHVGSDDDLADGAGFGAEAPAFLLRAAPIKRPL